MPKKQKPKKKANPGSKETAYHLGQLDASVNELGKRIDRVEEQGEQILAKQDDVAEKIFTKIDEIHTTPCKELREVQTCVTNIKVEKRSIWKTLVVIGSVTGGLTIIVIGILNLIW